MDYNEARQLYEKCLNRTESIGGGSEDGGSGGGDIYDANENATQPEECVRPETPNDDGTGSGSDYTDQMESYEDCLARTGDSGSGDGDESTTPGSSSECVAPSDDAPIAEQQEYKDCLAQSGELANDEPTTAAPTEGSDDGAGGILGIILDGFKGIMGYIWDWTFGWALE